MPEISREELERQLVEHNIPRYMHTSIIEYVMVGRPVGHFLTAIFSNNLSEAVARGDEENQKHLVDYVKFLYNHAPRACWGSPTKFKEWLEHRGMKFETTSMYPSPNPEDHGPKVDPRD